MKKKILVIIAGSFLCYCFLTACSNNKENNAEKETEITSDETEQTEENTEEQIEEETETIDCYQDADKFNVYSMELNADASISADKDKILITESDGTRYFAWVNNGEVKKQEADYEERTINIFDTEFKLQIISAVCDNEKIEVFDNDEGKKQILNSGYYDGILYKEGRLKNGLNILINGIDAGTGSNEYPFLYNIQENQVIDVLKQYNLVESFYKCVDWYFIDESLEKAYFRGLEKNEKTSKVTGKLYFIDIANNTMECVIDEMKEHGTIQSYTPVNEGIFYVTASDEDIEEVKGYIYNTDKKESREIAEGEKISICGNYIIVSNDGKSVLIDINSEVEYELKYDYINRELLNRYGGMTDDNIIIMSNVWEPVCVLRINENGIEEYIAPVEVENMDWIFFGNDMLCITYDNDEDTLYLYDLKAE